MPRLANKISANELIIYQDRCKGCGICVAFCPRGALSLNERGRIAREVEKCNLCGICETFCPDFAIVLNKGVNSLNA